MPLGLLPSLPGLNPAEAERLQELATVAAERKSEGLRIYRSMPSQMAFHLSLASERVIRGGNRCLTGDTEIWDPLRGTRRTLDRIDGDFNVLSRAPETGDQFCAKALKPFIKGRDRLYCVRLSNGNQFSTTIHHQLLIRDGVWMGVGEIFAMQASQRFSLMEPVGLVGGFMRDPGGELDGKQKFEPYPISIKRIDYLGVGNVWDFTVPETANYEHAGVIHHNSGKTTCAAAEFASAATRMPILGPDGLPIPHKYPIDRPLIMWVIGYDEKHIGDVIYPMLFGRRAFKMIRDAVSREWRAFCPWNQDDAARESEARLAPPFIPPRMIDAKGWGWEDKAKRIFTLCRLKNGTEIYAFSSKASPRQGVPVDVLWPDEDIFNSDHYAEWQARLSDRKGRLFWSAFPQCKNEALMNLSERAEADNDNPVPDVSEVVLRFSDNPYIAADEKRKRLKGWSADEAKARDDGEFLTESVLMYPSFSPLVHGCPNKDPALDDAVDKILRENEGQPPADWCRFLAFDPGNSPAAVLFCAIPPPEVGVDAVVAYDEIYGRGLNADELAGLVSQRTANYGFEAFIIDYRYGRQTPGGMGCTIKQLFAGAFARRSIRSRLTDSSFIDGSDDVLPGQQLVREWLAINPQTGRPKFRAYLPKLEFLPKEFTRHRKRMRDKEITDDPIRKDNHLLDCLRYLAAYNPTYVKPAAPEVKKSPVRALFQSWKDKREGDGNTICMGPGAAVA